MHFGSYLFSGIIGLSRHVELSLPVNIDFSFLILPVENFINLLTHNNISSNVSPFFVTINETAEKVSNVRSYFGTIYIYGGFIKGAALTFLSGSFLYSLYIFAFFKKQIVLILLYSIFLSGLFLGWFDFYYSKLFFYEIIAYSGLLWIINEIFKKRRL
jgi:hypothetical protein